MPWYVATVITQTRVDADDPAFANPSKPVGTFYDETVARAMMAAVEYVRGAPGREAVICSLARAGGDGR